MSENQARPHDIIVLGCGLAGSILSLILQAKGYRVKVLHRPKQGLQVGESIAPEASQILLHLSRKYNVTALKRMTTYESIQHYYPSVRCYPKRFFHFYFPGAHEHVYNQMTRYPALADIHAHRPSFDGQLYKLVNEADIDLEVIDSVEQVENTADAVHVSYSSGGQSLKTSGSLLIDCTGAASVVSRLKGWHTKEETLYQVSCLYSHFKKSPEIPGFDYNRSAATSHFLFKKSWAWHIPIDENTVSFGKLSLGRGITKEEMIKEVESSEHQCLDFKEAEWHFIQDLQYRSSQMVDDRIILMPQAAFLIDPFLSPGVYLAMLAIYRIDEMIDGLFARGSFKRSEMLSYEQNFFTEANALQYFFHSFYFTFQQPALFYAYYELFRMLVVMNGISLIPDIEHKVSHNMFLLGDKRIVNLIRNLHSFLMQADKEGRLDDPQTASTLRKMIHGEGGFLNPSTGYSKTRASNDYDLPVLSVFKWLASNWPLRKVFYVFTYLIRRYLRDIALRIRFFFTSAVKPSASNY